jgi:hypothetical protein
MIPYDDLVYALTQWRAQKGLPTSATPAAPPKSRAAAPPAPAAVPAPAAAPRPRPQAELVPEAPAAWPGAAAPARGAPAWPSSAPPAPGGVAALFQAPASQYATTAPYPDQEEAISIDGDEYYNAGDAMSFESARPGTQPGFAAPNEHLPPPGSRR